MQNSNRPRNGQQFRRGTSAQGSRNAQNASAEQQKAMSRRAVFSLLLLLLLPPLGLLLIWRRNIFEMKGRILLTVLAVLLMTVEFFLLTPSARVDTVSPMPVASSMRTAIPQDTTLNALSNMDQLLAGVENTTEDQSASAGDAVVPEEPEVTEEPDLLQTIVYSVRSGAKYYHAGPECNGQVNRRSLTVEVAISEGLKPCSRCKPVSP